MSNEALHKLTDAELKTEMRAAVARGDAERFDAIVAEQTARWIEDWQDARRRPFRAYARC